MEQLQMALELSRKVTRIEKETGQKVSQLVDQGTTQKESNLEDLVNIANVPVDTKDAASPCHLIQIGATTDCGKNLLLRKQMNTALDEFFSKSIGLFRKQKSELNFVKFCKKREEEIKAKYEVN